MNIQNQDEIKEEDEEYVDKIRYLGIDMSQNLEHQQKLLWLKTINWYLLADNIKDRIRDYIEKKMKTLDIIIIILAAIGVLTNGLQTYFYLDFVLVDNKDNTMTIDIISKSSNLVEGLRFITSGTSLMIIVFIIIHFQIKKNYLIFKHEIPFNSSFCSQNLIIPMIIEIIIILVHTPPFFNNMDIYIRNSGTNDESVPFDLNLFISFFMLIRVYLLFKFYANYSKWGGVFASRVCNECNAKGGFIFTYKAGLKEYPFFSVFILLILTILIFGYGVRNLEISFVKRIPIQYFQDWTHMANGFWYMTTNILLIGFGDFYPITHTGRIISFISCIWGILLESLLVFAVANCMKLNKKEELAYNDVEKFLEVSEYKKRALRLIYHMYHSHIIAFDIYESQNEKSYMKNNILGVEFHDKKRKQFNKMILKTKSCLLAFGKMRKNKEKKEREVGVQSLMTKLNIDINDNMNYLLRNIQTQINKLLENINQAKESQNEINLFTGILDVMHKSLYEKVKERTKSNGQVLDVDEIQHKKYKGKLGTKSLIEEEKVFKKKSRANIVN